MRFPWATCQCSAEDSNQGETPRSSGDRGPGSGAWGPRGHRQPGGVTVPGGDADPPQAGAPGHHRPGSSGRSLLLRRGRGHPQSSLCSPHAALEAERGSCGAAIARAARVWPPLTSREGGLDSAVRGQVHGDARAPSVTGDLRWVLAYVHSLSAVCRHLCIVICICLSMHPSFYPGSHPFIHPPSIIQPSVPWERSGHSLLPAGSLGLLRRCQPHL